MNTESWRKSVQFWNS